MSKQTLTSTKEPITGLLRAWSEGDPHALESLLPLVYQELRAIAKYHFSKEKPGHTLQATALIHEVYLSISGETDASFENRSQFYLYIGQVMRHLLVGHARSRYAQKRGGDQKKLSLMDIVTLSDKQKLDITTLLSLDEALNRLAKFDPRQVKLSNFAFSVA